MRPRRRILVVGGDSLIGAALARRYAADGHQVLTTTRRAGEAAQHRLPLDLAAAATGPVDLPPADLVILAAAVARIADCERDPEATRRVNVDGILQVARACAGRGARVLLLSTDKVFDGTRPHRRREEAVCPRTAYGQQKADAEAGVLALAERGLVLRLSKVLSGELDLVRDWCRRLAAGAVVEPFTDLFLAPTTPARIGRLIDAAVASDAAGIFQCTGSEDHSYVEFAAGLARRLGAANPRLKPKPAPETVVAAARCRYTTLDMSLEARLFGETAAALDDVIAELVPAPAPAGGGE